MTIESQSAHVDVIKFWKQYGIMVSMHRALCHQTVCTVSTGCIFECLFYKILRTSTYFPSMHCQATLFVMENKQKKYVSGKGFLYTFR